MTVICGDCVEVMAGMEAESFHAVVTDPPAGISFMSKSWDHDKGGRDQWIAWMQRVAAEALRVCKPGAHALVWALPRTSHWTAMAWENGGWVVRDRVAFLFGSGFPKNANALKPACEDWWLLRKPLSESTVATNVLKHGAGALNIEDCRIPTGERPLIGPARGHGNGSTYSGGINGSLHGSKALGTTKQARWPANVVHDGSEEVLDAFAKFGESKSNGGIGAGRFRNPNVYGKYSGNDVGQNAGGLGDTGTAARFFYAAKAAAWERTSDHPTQKPVALLEWLLRLVTPPGGRVLDPFCGTGSTLVAADFLGIEAVGIEQDPKTCADAEAKIQRLRARRMIGDAKLEAAAPGQLSLL